MDNVKAANNSACNGLRPMQPTAQQHLTTWNRCGYFCFGFLLSFFAMFRLPHANILRNTCKHTLRNTCTQTLRNTCTHTHTWSYICTGERHSLCDCEVEVLPYGYASLAEIHSGQCLRIKAVTHYTGSAAYACGCISHTHTHTHTRQHCTGTTLAQVQVCTRTQTHT